VGYVADMDGHGIFRPNGIRTTYRLARGESLYRLPRGVSSLHIFCKIYLLTLSLKSSPI